MPSPTFRFAAALSLLPVLALADPTLSGAYRTDSLGRLELSTQGDRLLGVTASSNACHFENRRRVLEGSFEGHVLVGTLTLCQTGPSCEQVRAYPVLAVYNPTDGSLAAHVKLQPGCQSPGLLKGGRLVLLPVGAESPLAVAEEGMGAASSIARKRDKRSTTESVSQLLKEGDAYFRAGDYGLAARRFEDALLLEAGNPVAHHGLGATLLMRGQEREAIKSLEKARTLGLSHPENAYLLACAYGRTGNKKRGREYLRQAVRLGYRVDAKLLSEDKDLQTLVENEAELETLVKQARARKQAASERQDPPSEP